MSDQGDLDGVADTLAAESIVRTAVAELRGPPTAGLDDITQPDPDAKRRVRAQRHWYGGEILLVDGIAVGLVGSALVLFASGVGQSEGEISDGVEALSVLLLLGGAGTYLVAPAYIHAQHERSGGVIASLAARIGLPVLGGIVGEHIDEGDPDVISLAVVLGISVAMLGDAAGAHAWTRAKARSSVTLLPVADSKGAGLSLVGSW